MAGSALALCARRFHQLIDMNKVFIESHARPTTAAMAGEPHGIRPGNLLY
jgi:hypothetical protein